MVRSKRRGNFLTSLLLLLFLFGIGLFFASVALAFFQFAYLAGSDLPNAVLSTLPFLFLALLSLGYLNLVYYIYHWKKWAFYGFCGVSFLMFVLGLVLGLGVQAFALLSGPILLFWLVMAHWKEFD